MKARSSIALLIALLLAGCGEQGNDKSQNDDQSPEKLLNRGRTPTVVWFLENPDALEATWKLCRSNPGEHASKSACVNAGQANERVLMLGRDRALSSLKQ